MVQALNPDVKHFNVPITSVVDYDIENLKLELKNYDLDKELNKVIPNQSMMDFSQFGEFCNNFVKDIP